MTQKPTPFTSATEAIAVSSAGFFRLVEVEKSQANFDSLFRSCEDCVCYSDGSTIFVGLGWCVRLLPRVSKVKP